MDGCGVEVSKELALCCACDAVQRPPSCRLSCASLRDVRDASGESSFPCVMIVISHVARARLRPLRGAGSSLEVEIQSIMWLLQSEAGTAMDSFASSLLPHISKVSGCSDTSGLRCSEC